MYLERRDEADQKIENGQFVDLSSAGVERFYFRAVEHIIEILVNKKPIQIKDGRHTGLEIKETAIAQGLNIGLDFVLSLHKAGGHTQIIGDQDPVQVHQGQCFTAIADDDKS